MVVNQDNADGVIVSHLLRQKEDFVLTWLFPLW